MFVFLTDLVGLIFLFSTIIQCKNPSTIYNSLNIWNKKSSLGTHVSSASF